MAAARTEVPLRSIGPLDGALNAIVLSPLNEVSRIANILAVHKRMQC